MLLAKMLEGQETLLDISSFLELDEADSAEAETIRQTQITAMAQFKATMAPIVAIKKARDEKQSMAVDEANHPKREAEDVASPDEQNPKRRAGQSPPENGAVQTVVPTKPAEAAPSQTAPPAPTTTAASSSKDGGPPPPQTSPHRVSKESLQAAARKAESDALYAELESETSDAAIAKSTAAALAVSKKMAEVPAGGDEDDDSKDS